MHPRLVLGVLLLAAACAPLPGPVDAGGEPPLVALPVVGEPLGDPAMATVGAAGGALTSPDGRLVVTVPPGALAADTPLGIQLVTNVAQDDSSFGAAYRLTPDGQTFATPVTLTFGYSDTDLTDGGSPDGLGVAFQSSDHSWNWVDAPVVDPVAHTVTVQSTHFTDWRTEKDLGFMLVPYNGTVKVGKTLSLRPEFTLAGTPPLGAVSGWSVLGIEGGSSTYGTIASSGGLEAVYTAPAVPPGGGWVIVSVDFQAEQLHTTLSTVVTIVPTTAYAGSVVFSGRSVSASGTTTVYAGRAFLALTLQPSATGGLVYQPAPQSRVRFDTYLTFRADESCELLSAGADSEVQGGLVVQKAISTYNLSLGVANPSATLRCTDTMGKVRTRPLGLTATLTSGTGDGDPGFAKLGTGKVLSGTANYHYTTDSLTGSNTWVLQKVE